MGTDKIRVLVVDDSSIFRRIVTNALEGDAEIEVVGSAPNGKIALQKIERLRPDVLTLDVEMPEMDGLETLSILSKEYPGVQVIMVSSITERGAAATIDALSLGAFDFIAKPSGKKSFEASQQALKEELLPKVKRCGTRNGVAVATAPRRVVKPVVPTIPVRRDVVLIGVSTGGPNALQQVIPNLPGDLPAGVLIVQHMPPVFTAQLAARLNGLSALTVKEAKGGEKIEAGRVLIAPGGRHMVVETKAGLPIVSVNDDAPENNCKPAVDPMFRTAAEFYGKKSLGVILTGMGQDGLEGAKVLKAKSSYIIAQDEQSSVVYGMPRFIVENDLADKILPLSEIAGEITQIVTDPLAR